MPINAATIIAGAFAIVVFILMLIGLFVAFRHLLRWIDKVISYSNMVKKNDWEIELIRGHIEKDHFEFERELLLMNAFNKRELRNLIYAFIKRQRKLKGGKKYAR